MKTSAINLPLHTGHAPQYLIRRMIRLSHAISKVIVDEYGQQEFLRRLSDPLWFQALGCVLGFDWHSSGLSSAIEGAEIERIDRIQALRKLAQYSARIFDTRDSQR